MESEGGLFGNIRGIMQRDVAVCTAITSMVRVEWLIKLRGFCYMLLPPRKF